jgi:type II secretory pathway pseudopilin PulG
MKRACKTRHNDRGFTMIEMVMILILLAIFMTTVTIRYVSISHDVRNESEILTSSLRFAQIKAMTNAIDNNTWGINYTSGGTSYTLVYINNGVMTSPINLPGECGNNPMVCVSTPTHNLPSGMTITGNVVRFDKWGSPGASDVDIVLAKAGSSPVTVKVTKNTGYVLIQ